MPIILILSIPSTFDLFFSIKLLIMIALGGMYNIWGAIIGAGLITFLSYEWLHYFEEFEVIVYGAILLLVTIFLPHGLGGDAGNCQRTGSGDKCPMNDTLRGKYSGGARSGHGLWRADGAQQTQF